MADGQVVFEISADGKKAYAAIEDITKAMQQAGKKWEGTAAESSNNIQKSFQKAFNVERVKNWAIEGVKALVELGKASIDAASDLQEVQNVVDTTFGESASRIESWATKAGQQFGLTQLQAKQFTSTLGAMMKSAGVNGNEIVEMSTDLAGLAADMASFYNLDFETAFQKIRSGISGETEPLKQLGVNMSVANLEAFALEKGITKAFNSMSQGEQTVLRYQYLMQATADAQGDFAKTADGYANSTRRIETALDTLKTNVGTYLLDGVLGPAQSMLADFLEQITQGKPRTVLDEFNEIDLNTADKIAQINETMEQATALVNVLDNIQVKSGNVSPAVQQIADALSGIDFKKDKASVLTGFLETLNSNISAISAVTGKDAAGAQAWVDELARTAGELSPEDAEAWQAWVNAIFEVLPGLENTTAGQELLATLTGIQDTRAGETLAKLGQQIGEIDPTQGKKSAVQSFLETLNQNLNDSVEATGKSPEEVKNWLESISNAANNLDEDSPAGWAELVAAINEGFPELEGVEEWQALSAALLGISNSTADQDLKRIAQQIGEINPEQGKKSAVNEFLETLKGNLEQISAITGKSPDEIENWLEGISTAANNLDENSAEGWSELVAAINEGFPELTNVKEWQDLSAALLGISNTTASSKLNEVAGKLNEIDINQSKAGVLKEALTTLRENVEALSAVTGADAEGLLDFFAAIEEQAGSLDENDLAGWAAIAEMLRTGLPGLEDTEGGKSLLQVLGEDVGKVGDESSKAAEYLAALGINSEDIADKQNLWLQTCKRLVQVLPGLSSIINTETGEVKGGIDAVREYIKAWGELETKTAVYNAYEQKGEAIKAGKSEIDALRAEIAGMEESYPIIRDKIMALVKKYNIGKEFEKIGFADAAKMSAEDSANFTKWIVDYYNLEGAIRAAREELQRMMDAQEEAEILHEGMGNALEKTYGKLEKSSKSWSESEKESARAAVAAVKEATQALTEYYESMLDVTKQAIDAAVSGFDVIESRDTKLAKLDKLIADQQKLGGRTEENAKEWDKLNSEIKEYEKNIAFASTMKSGLESQKAFMEEYIANLEKAREMGLSDELLASLADGSVESAEYLAALVDPKAGGLPGEIDALFKQVQELKGDLSKTLTNQKLTVDETYDAMAEKAKEAVAAMSLFSEAEDSMGQTVAGLAQGIQDHVSDVKTAVDAIIEQLDRLNGYGISIDFGSFGAINVSLGKTIDGEFATGLDRVPFDGFLASLHEGEGILTAEENRIWQRFKNGQATNGVDYDTLGGVMRDNVHAGGNVYLDGRTVGHVISDMQGQSYKALQRSGWQQ